MAEELDLKGRPLNLTQALKWVGWADNGGMAKVWIAEGQVRVNGEVELRKRRQLSAGDRIEMGKKQVLLVRDSGSASPGDPLPQDDVD